MPDSIRREIIRLAAGGGTHMSIAAEVGMSRETVRRVISPMGWVLRAEAWRPSDSRLSIDQRVEIRLGLERGESFRCIGAKIGRAASTVCREVNANGGRARYRPMVAHRRAQALAKRPKPTKFSCNRALRERVTADLLEFWSPQQITRRLREDFGDDTSMNISHETIYKSLYVQGRGSLRRELARCLRTGRARRRRHGRVETRGRIPDMVLISERPAEVEDRAVPGHWEGDLLMGKDNKNAIGTLVERQTRYVMLLDLRKGFTAVHVRDAMVRTIKTLPESLRRSVTWDQGGEMAQHAQFTIDTGVQVYFCDPHSPWQRGSNENTNGLLRQYFPKGTDLSVHGPAKLRKVAASLNGRPRETLNWRTPAEKFAELVATTD
ncbi:MAG: IS30 family transposase [Actinomycetota bacterium]